MWSMWASWAASSVKRANEKAGIIWRWILEDVHDMGGKFRRSEVLGWI